MSIKLKLVSCISAFILVLGIFIFGVLSAEQATVNLGGSISFDATDVYARVTGRVQNAQTNPTLQPLEFSADNDNPDQSSWSGLQLQFDSQATNITIEVTVENLSMERTLTVNLTDMIQTSTDNLRKTISLDGGIYLSGANETIPVATSNDENNTSKVTFVITFDVIDHNSSLLSTNFDYDINLYDESYTPPTSASSFRFSFDDNNYTATVTGFSGSESEVVIPSTVNKLTETTGTEGSDYRVTAIGREAFFRASIDSVVIPEGVTSIGSMAFYQAYLESISIPDSITSIDSDAFFVFHSNFKYNTHNGVNYIGNRTNPYVVLMNDDTFTGNDYQIPEGCKLIFSLAFDEDSTLTSVTIPSSVTTIDEYAFRDCTSLTSIEVDLANIIYSSEDGVVFNKDKTTLIICPGGRTGSYSIPEGVTNIGDLAFHSCSRLTSIAIPSSVTTIGDEAFFGCWALVEVYNYSSLTIVNNKSNGYVENYAKVIHDLNAEDSKPATRIKDYNGVRYYDDGENTVVALYPLSKNITTVSLDNKTTEIQPHAFRDCSGLTSITIPNSITSIGDYAFSGCSSLTSVDFGDNSQLTSISTYAFYYCTSLTSITIPSSVTSIEVYAFQNCNLASITIDSRYAYLNAEGSLSISNYLLQYANTVRVSEACVTELGLDANSYLNSNFNCDGTPVDGYYVFTRNQ